MKELILDIHTDYCIKHSNSIFNLCENNPNKFLCYVCNDFYLINYFGCIGCGDKYELYESFINRIIGKTKIFETFNINRFCLDKELKDDMNFCKKIKKYIHQINYIYSDAAGKRYAITTKAKLINTIINNDLLEANYKKAKTYLIENGYENLIDQLNRLYNNNKI